MNTAYLSAISALAGSAIGGLAVVAASWLTQRYQDRSQRVAQINARRERIFGEFIDQASRTLADALSHGLEDPSKLVSLYASVGKLRLFASSETVARADAVMSLILDAYYNPNIDFSTRHSRTPETQDVLRPFIEACQAELADTQNVSFGRYRPDPSMGRGPLEVRADSATGQR